MHKELGPQTTKGGWGMNPPVGAVAMLVLMKGVIKQR